MRTPRVKAPRARGRSKLLALFAALTVIGTLGIAPALAVHDEDFQLDGDEDPAISQNTPGDPAEDWQSLFNSTGGLTGIDPEADDGFNDGAFVRDFQSKNGRNGTCSLTSTGLTFCTADATTFATGSKDTLEITPGWQCNQDNNVNSKIDIMNAFAAQYIDPATGDQIMYFGLEKNKDNGNNNVAFWFLQGNANCVSPGGNTPFTGTHADGDVLVVSAFTNGGGVSNINAYRWDGDADCIDNPVNPANCDGAAIGSGGDCKANAGGDNICATTNSGTLEENDNITTTWLTSDATLGVGHTVVTTDFFEGGINLTNVFEGVGEQAPSCFNTFLGNTRSSQELTATLFDFARGQLGGCETTLTTDAGDNGADGEEASPTSIGTGSVSSGTDTATLTIDGTDNWAGTLTWSLCGPGASLTTCDPDDGVEVTSRDVDQDSSGADFISGTATLTSVGKYCWTAVFVPDEETAAAGVSGDQDDGTNECFTVAPVTPDISTEAISGPVTLGTALDDTATLTGTATQPGDDGPSSVYPSINATNGAAAGGTITFTAYGPHDDTTTCGTEVYSSEISVSGDGDYKASDGDGGTFTPSSAGIYNWIAVYSGNSPNTNSIAGDCGDPNETGAVGPVTPTIVTNAISGPVTIGGSIDDTATLSGTSNQPDGDAAEGTITFTAYGPHDDDQTCETVAYTSVVNVSGDGDYTASDGDGGTFTPPSAGIYNWIAVYSGDPPNTNGASGKCGDANEGSLIVPITPAIVTNATVGPVTIGGSIDDTATLSGTSNQPDGDPAEGTVTFTAYGPHDDTTTCDTVAYTSVVNVSGDGDYKASDGDGGTFTPLSAGTYNWIAVYSGDPPNTNSVSGKCGDANEASVIGPAQPAIVTVALSGPVTIGGVIDDTATLSGTANQPDGDPAGGTITFTAYGPHEDTETCETVAYTSVVNVSGDGDYTASDGTGGEFKPVEAGIYNWIAVYSGDPPNTEDVAGECGDDNETSTIGPAKPAITTEAMSGPVPLGASISDVATLTGTAPQPDGDPAEGTITFTAYGPHEDTETCTTVAYTSVVNVSGDGPYVSSAGNGGTFIPTEPGIYNWIAVYSGDPPNTEGVAGECGDDNEFSIVQQLTPVVATEQTWRPQDEATITVVSGGGALNGTVDFELFDDEDCTGTALYDEFDVAIDVAVDGLSATAATNNIEFDVSTSTQVWWKVTYDSDNLGHTDAFSVCVEDTSLEIDNSTPPGP